MGSGIRPWFVLFALSSMNWANGAETRLVLAGGSSADANHAAVKKMLQWMGEKPGHMLRIRWASEKTEAGLLSQTSYPFPEGTPIKEAPSRFEMPKERERFLRDLKGAAGVYFGGGDQRFIMNTLLENNLLAPMHEVYRLGVVFGGTSAGTAIMSSPMFTGEGVETGIGPEKPELIAGLGLLGPGIIVDQHFLARKRFNRLVSAVSGESANVGLGIDEDGAVSIVDGRMVTVLPPEKVVAVKKHSARGRFTMDVMEPGESYDLQTGEKGAKP